MFTTNRAFKIKSHPVTDAIAMPTLPNLILTNYQIIDLLSFIFSNSHYSSRTLQIVVCYRPHEKYSVNIFALLQFKPY
ncbi:MAG: hypothetical protein ACFCU7_00800 [Pleurocapsa sp.]